LATNIDNVQRTRAPVGRESQAPLQSPLVAEEGHRKQSSSFITQKSSVALQHSCVLGCTVARHRWSVCHGVRYMSIASFV